MQQKYFIFIAIILGSVIVGGFFYFAISKIVPQNNVPVTMGYKSGQSDQQTKVSECKASDNTIATKVIDGDTIVVEGGYHVRLLGMDADEKGYPCYELAKTRLEELVLNKQITLEKDTTNVDQYGRCLRTIFLGNENIDLELVKEGLAVARFYEPDVKYKNEISVAEKKAIENKTGCKWKNN